MAKKVQLCRIGLQSRPPAYQQAIDGVQKVLSPEMVAQKAIFRFLTKNQLRPNKVCYKVSLCKNFQQQSCSTAIPVSNGP